MLRPDGTADCPDCDLPLFPLSISAGTVHLECANRHHGEAPLPAEGPLRRAAESWITRRGAQLHEQHERWGTDAATEEEEDDLPETPEIRLIRPQDRTRDTTQTPGMTREAAIASDRLWAGFVRTAPSMASGWHHHGDHETSIYVLKGRARIEFGKGGASSVDAREGDFIHVPPHVIHRELNPTTDEGVIVVVRGGTGAPTVNVEGPAE